ncbi:MAG: sulfotransferase [Cyclobacteriaceae bacterium]
MKKKGLARLLVALMKILPNRFSLRDKSSVHNQPFFIFGSGRNGSTLLNVMLNQHSKIFLPPEQYFLGNSIIKYQLYNHILWRDLIKIIYAELIPETGSHSWKLRPDKIIDEAFHFTGEQRTLENLIHHIYISYADQLGEKPEIWGDTTPYNTQYLNEVYDLFPKAKYVFLLRDGRDVVAAYKKPDKKIIEELSDPINSAKHWLGSIQKYQWLKKRASVHMIKYEDLVENTEEQLKALLNFLGFDYENKTLEFHKNIPDIKEYREEHHENLFKPIQNNSIGQWESILTQEEKETVIPRLEKSLRQFDYLKS